MALAARETTGWEFLLPRVVEVEYKDSRITFQAQREWRSGQVSGYSFKCPKCGQHVAVSPSQHSITVLDGKLTVRQALLHAECGWHVIIRNGYMYDCVKAG